MQGARAPPPLRPVDHSPMLKQIAVPLLIMVSASVMAFAWIGHLKWAKSWSFLVALGFSWLLVLPEYILNVYATRWGKEGDVYTGAQMAAVHLCSGVVFVTLVSRFFLKEPMQPRQVLGFVLMGVALALIMYRGDAPSDI